ncbi:UNVERIFIED_CONTAM: putative N-acetyltransferase YoaA [Sesamum latifolium]|uniref:N-acetyltransferase YoaA n=1 Tax=Sesamum latifolium TaxID=2727402 RepID=A0AAW2YEX5_9LAMI
MDPSRITLRPFKLSDADDMLVWAGDNRVTRSLRWKTLTSKDEALAFIEQDDRCRADLGYAIGVEYWGQGITTRAVKMATAQVFNDFPEIVRLQAFASVENKASQRVLERAGFVKEGLLRKYSYLKGSIQDVLVFSFLSADHS